MNIRAGRYKHYKGAEYEVIGSARHSETEEWLVVYTQCYGDCSMWVRPAQMFTEWVETEQGRVERFRYIGDASMK